VYRIDALAVGDWQVRDLDIGVLELGSRGTVDGLLGMDFLQHFRFFIDQNRAELRLSLREP
jgi:predicted aspartyl protease